MIEEGTTNDLTPASLCLPEKFRGPSRVDAFEMGLELSSTGNANLFVIRILVFYWNLNRQFGEGDQAAAWT